MLAFEDATVPEQARRAPRGIRPTAETEQEDVVARIVLLDDEPIGILDMLRQAPPEHAPTHAVPQPGADAGAIVDRLRDAVGGIGRHGECHLGNVAGTHLATIHLVRHVPGPVTTDHQPLDHAPSQVVSTASRWAVPTPQGSTVA